MGGVKLEGTDPASECLGALECPLGLHVGPVG